MDTTLPGLTSMRTLDPMSMCIHTVIMAPTITPINGYMDHNKLQEAGIFVYARLMALQRYGV